MHIVSTVLLAFVLITSSLPILAQKKLTPGHIITLNSDTIAGFIRDKNWDKNPVFVQFKRHQKEAFQTYLPAQLQAFQLSSGERYKSHIVAIDKSASKLASVQHYPAMQVKMDTVFLTVLVQGKANLYYLKDLQAKVHFFIQKDKGPIEELILLKYLQESKTGNGGKALVVVHKYKGQLLDAFADCPEIASSIRSVKYTPESLQKLFVEYNQCLVGQPIPYSARLEKVTVKAGLLAGGSHTKLQFVGDGHKELTGAPFTKAFSYTLGASFDILLPRSHQKWSLYNEFRWKSYQVSALYQEKKSDQYYTLNNLSFDIGYINWSSMVRYRCPMGKLQPFVNAGICNALAVKVGNENTVESRFYTNYRIEQEEAIEHFRKREFGFCFGIGAKMRAFSGELRYEVGDGMSSYQNLKSTSKTTNFLVVYSF